MADLGRPQSRNREVLEKETVSPILLNRSFLIGDSILEVNVIHYSRQDILSSHFRSSLLNSS